MPILKLKYTSENNDYITVTTDTSTYSAPWPCHTWHAQAIQEAIDSGMKIEEFQSLTDLQLIYISRITNERDRRYEEGGYYVASVDKWFHSTQFSRGQQLGLVQLGTNLPEGVQWKTMDSTYVTMTLTLSKEILVAASLSDMNIFSTAETKKLEILAIDNITELKEYSCYSNWPKIFGE